MLDTMMLLPRPRLIQNAEGHWSFTKLQRSALLNLKLAHAGVMVRIDPMQITQPQGYRIMIRPGLGGVRVLAHDAAGAQHAAVTLRQLVRQVAGSLPAGRIDDHPDFAFRGYMLDISRDKVPTMATLYRIVDLMVELKLNQLQLYTEHTFAYRQHRKVWAKASPMTAQQVRQLDAYCRTRQIELVPNQNCFGHMERWLEHELYCALAEAPEGFKTPWDYRPNPTTLAPQLPGSMRLVKGLFDELLPNFTSRQVNIGCDETWDLGQGKSKGLCDKLGKGRVYLEFLCKVQKHLERHGKSVQFWGDVIMQHPERVAQLPADMIALEWGYEAHHPFAEHGAKFAASGVPFYVCPGTSTWNTLVGRTNNALANLRNAAENGLHHGAIGYLITDWGDNGHMQPLGASFVPLAFGAAVSWSLQRNRDIDLAKAADLHVFEDKAGVMGRLVMDLGNAYQVAGSTVSNASTLAIPFYQMPDTTPKWLSQAAQSGGAQRFCEAERYVANTIAGLKSTDMRCVDAQLLKEEFAFAADMLQLGCRINAARCEAADQALAKLDVAQRQTLTQALENIMREYPRIWKLRNRPGGLSDSLARLKRLHQAMKKVGG